MLGETRVSRIFLSHSSKNNDSAVALRDWLVGQGWDDVFLDLDPNRGIAAGDRWERSLNQAALRCEAVLFLVSRAWLASDWCLKEFNLAHRLNKRLFGLLIDDIPVSDLPATLTGTWQLVPLAAGRDHIMLRAVLPGTHDEVHVTFSQEGLTRLRIGLERAGLDAKFFAWPPQDDLKRPPYRGLLPLEAADAGIFFGREAPTIAALDRIRGIKDGAAPRLLVLLGASGAGKSSFLRAGLLPRLMRDDRSYLAVPVIRPERAAINGEAGLLRSLEAAFAAHGMIMPRAEIREAIGGGATTLRPLLQSLIDHARIALVADEADAKTPVLVLAIDQGEELFLTDGASESLALLNLLRELLAEDAPALLAVITIRSDAYEQLQISKALEGVTQHPLSLTPMPRGAYQAVIEGPAARLKETDRPLVIEPALTQALLSDIEDGGGRDALPLLAFTLERLYLEYGGRGRLMLEDYDALGRIKGSIEAAVERAFVAADSDARIPRDREARLALLRRGLIPWLAGIDPDTGSPRRQKARISEIPEEARPLIGLLVEQRLLSTDVADDTGERTIEPAHESLLRQWGSLQGWLQEDFAALTNLETLKRAARDWAANAKGEDWLAHRAGRLEDAERLLQRTDLVSNLSPTDRAYLAVCREREETERKEKAAALERRLRLQRRFSVAAALAAVVMTAIGMAAYREKTKADVAIVSAEANLVEAKAERNRALVTQSRFLADLANQQIGEGDTTKGLALALAALPDEEDTIARPDSPEAETALFAARQRLRENAVFDGRYAVEEGHNSQLASAEASTDGRAILVGLQNGAAQVWDADTKRLLFTLGDTEDSWGLVKFSPNGLQAVTGSIFSSTLALWNVRSGAQIALLKGHTDEIRMLRFSPDGMRIATAAARKDRTVRLWDARTGVELHALIGHIDQINSIEFSADSRRIVTGSRDHTGRIWNAETGQPISALIGHDQAVFHAKFSSDGRRVLTISEDGTARLWDSDSAKTIGVLSGLGKVNIANFSPDGKRLVTASEDGAVRIWNPDDAKMIGILTGHSGKVQTAKFSPDGQRLVTASEDGTARIWNSDSAKQIFVLEGHKGNLTDAVFSPDGRRLATASDDHTARLWDGDLGTSFAVLIGHTDAVFSVAFSPDGRQVLTASKDGTTRTWDAELEFGVLAGHRAGVITAAFSSDGRRIVTASADRTARIWDAQTGKPIGMPLVGHDGPVWSAAFSPDDKRIVTASEDGTARIWDADNGSVLHVLLDQNNRKLKRAAFSPDGKWVITSIFDFDWGAEVQIWDADTGEAVGAEKRHKEHLDELQFRVVNHRGLTGVDLPRPLERVTSQIAVSPDDKIVVSRITGRYGVGIWDIATGHLIRQYGPGPYPIPTSAGFSPTGNILEIAFAGSVWLLDVKTMSQIGTLGGHEGDVRSAVFSHDEKRIITASDDRTARVWDIARRGSIAILAGHNLAVNDAEFSLDGNWAVTASDDRTARVWRLSAGQVLVNDARRALPRCLNSHERISAFLDVEPPSWCIEMGKWPYATPDWKTWLKYKRENAHPPLPGAPEWKQWLVANKIRKD
jgi:WD40 repeat protein